MSTEPFIGSIVMFAGNFAPRGWAFCAGQLLPIAQNTALFSILGTTYGGNGQTTFALPDLRGRTPAGAGQGPGLPNVDLGQVGGSNTVTLTVQNLPAHNHLIMCDNTGQTSTQPSGLIPGVSDDRTTTLPVYSGNPANATMSPQMVGMAGSGLPVSVQDPYLGLNYIIALEGIFPSRN
ncbi:MAG: tail fiber protein [Candidatus Solibacter sp.]